MPIHIHIYLYIAIHTYIYPYIPIHTHTYPYVLLYTHTYPYIPLVVVGPPIIELATWNTKNVTDRQKNVTQRHSTNKKLRTPCLPLHGPSPALQAGGMFQLKTIKPYIAKSILFSNIPLNNKRVSFINLQIYIVLIIFYSDNV